MRLEYEAVLIMQCSSSLASPFGRLNFNYSVTLQKDISCIHRGGSRNVEGGVLIVYVQGRRKLLVVALAVHRGV